MISALPTAILAESPAAQPVISIQTGLLVILVVAVVFVANALAGLRRRVEKLEAELAPQPLAPPASPGLIAPEVVVAISAAVYCTLGPDQLIVSITTAGQSTSWSVEGRRQVFASRKVR